MKVASSVYKLREKQTRQGKRRGDLAPNPEMWNALDDGKLLNKILEDFYKIIFEDDRLAPFFEGSTKQRAKEKQFLFMKAIFTGEKCYFGERPRNAHSWMVISNELFDYREKLMEDALRKHGLAENFIIQWRAVDEVYRKQIVKKEPITKKVDGVELPTEGYQFDIIESASLCDSCENEINLGEKISYHVRTGKTYCKSCTPEVLLEKIK